MYSLKSLIHRILFTYCAFLSAIPRYPLLRRFTTVNIVQKTLAMHWLSKNALATKTSINKIL